MNLLQLRFCLLIWTVLERTYFAEIFKRICTRNCGRSVLAYWRANFKTVNISHKWIDVSAIETPYTNFHFTLDDPKIEASNSRHYGNYPFVILLSRRTNTGGRAQRWFCAATQRGIRQTFVQNVQHIYLAWPHDSSVLQSCRAARLATGTLGLLEQRCCVSLQHK